MVASGLCDGAFAPAIKAVKGIEPVTSGFGINSATTAPELVNDMDDMKRTFKVCEVAEAVDVVCVSAVVSDVAVACATGVGS